MKKRFLNNSLHLVIITFAIIFFAACTKTEKPEPPAPIPTVTASVAGVVTDLNNNPLSNASVTAGSLVTATDVAGTFNIQNVQLNADGGFIKVTKPGYFDGSRTFLANAGKTSNVKIKLIPRAVSGTFAAANGGTITISGGGAVAFTSASIINAASGSSYTGDVSVASFYLNPTDANFKDFMPGDLHGVNTTNHQGILKSFGMITVEMNDAGGQKLQLANNKTATVTIPIPSAMQASAPASIALWYFDDTNGIWKEEGTATKQSTNYVGTVKHFSFWNAGELAQDARLDATFKADSSGAQLVNKLVTITSTNYGTRNGYTDNTGKVSGFVPVNEILVMKVFNDCGNAVYTNNIGPFSANTDLGTIAVAAGNAALVNVTINGNAVNCTNAAVVRGSVRLTMGGDNYSGVINNGAFSIVFSRCSSSFSSATVTAYDSVTNQAGNPVVLSLILAGSQNIGQVSACAFPPPVAGFTYTATIPFAPDTVIFTNTSTNSTSYLWNFGDGATSTVTNPAHIYTTAGDYTVTLTATGNGGTNSTSKILHVINPVDTYVSLTLNGTNYLWIPPEVLTAARIDSGSYSTTSIQGGNAQNLPVKYFLGSIYNSSSTGNFPFSLYTIVNGSPYNTYYPNSNPSTNVSEYGPVGGYVTGSASGWIKNFPLPITDSLPFSCTYRVKRTQ